MTNPSGPATAHEPTPLPKGKLRFVTAASLFDGHDAAINIMRRILQAEGAEVIHLGHNRSVAEVVDAALQEDAHAIALSSYQGGHVEYLKYMVDRLRDADSASVRVFAGGGGVIVSDEIAELQRYGVERIYSPADGQLMGLEGMIRDMFSRCTPHTFSPQHNHLDQIVSGCRRTLSRLISAIEDGRCDSTVLNALRERAGALSAAVPVLGITGTGGAGKSSLTDEIIRRFRLGQQDQLKIAIIAVDPTRRKTGGALLGDRIRMNAIEHPAIYMRSLATRNAVGEIPDYLHDVIAATRLAGFDLVVVETPGIGQGDAGIVPFVDSSLYVMTPEFGAQSQLEKIDMLDFADVVAINKFDRKGAEDAWRDVCKQVQRNRAAFTSPVEAMPVFGTIAARFNDDGVTALYHALCDSLVPHGLTLAADQLPREPLRKSSANAAIVPPERVRYLAEIAATVRHYHQQSAQQASVARDAQQLASVAAMLQERQHDSSEVVALLAEKEQQLSAATRTLLEQWPVVTEQYRGDVHSVTVREREIRSQLTSTTLSGTQIRRVALPGFQCHGELLRWLFRENLPGYFPFTAGVFPFKREGEDPTRMFAGEGDPQRTNARFKKLSEHAPAKRLSTAFDSVTLYGRDPDPRPDIYGRIGNSGVSVATLDDMKALYEGFDLCDPATSVSMTINGPAPMILAMFINTAIDQQVARFIVEQHRQPDADEASMLRQLALRQVRGTVQADILKEDQGQNTCIFSTEFALKLMGDIQAWFIEHQVRNFYSVSISGYHIAEAGANPISQLAFTLANGFTYVETYLARGMHIDDFAPNLSFFFSNGMDPEYTVLGRVARRIWAVTLRDKYGANERSQKLKYHIQTSGRSLHAQEMDFNDIRTTLQALIAIYDNCNSLHTNAYDEAITTPTDESVRRALAIQLIINNEWGLAKNENPNQGSFIIEQLTDLVEEAVLQEFERLAERGGVLGAMETGYQRGRIQDESMLYEHRKHDGSLPIIGVNTFINPLGREAVDITLARSTEAEKLSQIERTREFRNQHAEQSRQALQNIRDTALRGGNIFAELIDAVRVCTLGQISELLFEVGGQYRRNM